MNKNKKPLFSKPVLAGIMIFSTLAIWALNATAPKSPTYPELNIESWQTDSGIPVIWLTQDAWKNTNKLKIRFSFKAPTQNLALTDATLSLMLDDPLSLISSTINQRLSPLTASVSSYYDHEGQILDITANSAPQYLIPTLDLLTQWLTQPEFKVRSFDRWQRRPDTDLPSLYKIQQALFVQNDAPENNQQPGQNYAEQQRSVTRKQVSHYYTQLTQQVSRITLVGNMDRATEQTIKTRLNQITQGFKPATPVANTLTIAHSNTWVDTKTPQENASQSQGQSQNGIALAPIRSVQDWISLQIWGADLVSTLKQQENIAYIRLNLILSPTHPWAWWRIQYTSRTNTIKATNAAENGVANKTDSANSARPMTPKDAIDIEKLPSVIDKKRFESLFTSFKTQLNEKTQSPDWWSTLITEVTQPGGAITPTMFTQNAQNAIDTFTQEDYQKALKHLLITTSYQESQVHP